MKTISSSLAAVILLGAVLGSAHAEITPPLGLVYHPIDGCRVLDSRAWNDGAIGEPIPAARSIHFTCRTEPPFSGNKEGQRAVAQRFLQMRQPMR